MIPLEVNKERAPPKHWREVQIILSMVTWFRLNLEDDIIIMLNLEVIKVVISVESNREEAEN